MNSTPSDSTQNPGIPQSPSALDFHDVDHAAAASLNSPIAPSIGGMPDPTIAPLNELPPWDINRDMDEADPVSAVEPPDYAGIVPLSPGATPDPHPQKLSNKQRRKLDRLRKFIDQQDWRTGVTKHQQTYASLLRAAHLGIPATVAVPMVIEVIERSGGDIVPDQIKRQAIRAYQYIQGNAETGIGSLAIRAIPKAKFRPEELERIAGKLSVENILEFVRSRSPIRPDGVDCADFLSIVFKKGEKVVVFDDMMSQGQFVWKAGSLENDNMPVRGEKGVWYLANPVDGEFHHNPREDKRSRRSEESVTDFRHLVLESDVADPVLWLKAVAQMPLRIIAIYRSGGKSIHVLINVSAASKKDWDTTKDILKRPLVTLGADLGAMTAVRLSRLPQAWRGDRCQELLFLDPEPDGVPICKKAVRAAATAVAAQIETEVPHVI